MYSLLSGDTGITNDTDSVSAVVCKDEEAKNYLLFYLDGVKPADDNDVFGKSGTYSYRVMIVHEEYAKIEKLQTDVIRVLNEFEGISEGNNITECVFTNVRDSWAEELDRFARFIHFDITVNE